MAVEAIVISERCLALMREVVPSLRGDWFLEDQPTSPDPRVSFVRRGQAVFVLPPAVRPSTRKLIVAAQNSDLQDALVGGSGALLLDRCIRFALSQFEPTIKLPHSWKAFHHDNLVSFFAFPPGLGGDRLVAQVNPGGSGDVFVCGLTDSAGLIQLESYVPRTSSLIEAARGFSPAVTQLAETSSRLKVRAVLDQIDLGEQPTHPLGPGLGYEEWLQQLSDEQRRFVEHPLSGPIKLRGAAGTGKTIAMALKALGTLYDAISSGAPRRILFLTHSWAAAEVVDRLLAGLDSRDVYRRPLPHGTSLDVMPLLSLVEDELSYKNDGIQPLGSDSHEGKQLQLEAIKTALSSFRATDWLAYRGGCGEGLRSAVEAPDHSRESSLLAWNLMNEFGCVLGAQRVKTGDPRRADEYLTGRRPSYAMPLALNERRFVLRLYERYLEDLRAKRLMTSDQMVNDYLGRLSTFFWESVRAERGWDVLFVDEMHLFNEQERLVFHQLVRRTTGEPPVVMALDPKQSPRDTFLEFRADGAEPGRGNIFERAGLGAPADIVLTRVYRYTPEIATVVQKLDRLFPGLDLGGGDWGLPGLETKNPRGALPRAYLVQSAPEQLELALAEAETSARRQKKRYSIALLCMDHERFEQYLRAQWLRDRVVAIRSREDTDRLRYFPRRFVLSQAEYVAGLQFDTVIVLDANRDHGSSTEDNGFSIRRFLSELYLAVTRAEKTLVFVATEDRGGFASTVERLLQAGVVQRESKG